MVSMQEIASLPQIDIAKLGKSPDFGHLPSVFIPVFGKNLAPEKVKYALLTMGVVDNMHCFRPVCLRAFTAADGQQIMDKTAGGIVDVFSYISQKDSSWVTYDSGIQASQIVNNSLVANHSIIKNSKISGSVIDGSQVAFSQIFDSRVEKDSLIFDYCRLYNGCEVVSSQLCDRVVAENSKIMDSTLFFCTVDGSCLRDEHLGGNPNTVEQKKIYDYTSPQNLSGDTAAPLAKNSKLFFRRRGR